MKSKRTAFLSIVILVTIGFLAGRGNGQENQAASLNAESFANDNAFSLDKSGWKYNSGDKAEWAARDFDDSAWERLEILRIDFQNLPASGWNGRGWFRLHFTIDESLINQNLALMTWQTGASEIFLDGEKIATFGTIKDIGEIEFNPNSLPVLIRFEKAGEHILAARFSNSVFADPSKLKARWMINGGVFPYMSFSLKPTDDATATTLQYANRTSMRTGVFFIGVLTGLAFLHFLLYVFYRAERANLFYSLYALAFAFNLICGNLRAFGHQNVMSNAVLRAISISLLASMFICLLAFLRTAFETTLGKIFWMLSVLWLIVMVLSSVYVNNIGNYRYLANIAIFLSFSYSIYLVIKALREKYPDAWILLSGVQLFALGMFSTLVNQFSLLNLPGWAFALGEILLILSVPIAVSIFLARKVARTNRDLKTQLSQVETLSAQKIEQERQATELRAENERRTKELEEARALQLSMLPKKLPELPNLEIAAYMKPATEVGGDYYDFHVSKDGTLTVAVGDATGHGLKAGTVVTATKSLFSNLAPSASIPGILNQISHSLKAMNLRGLFMAMTMLKIKGNQFSISAAGMPSTLIYRQTSGEIEEINLRALPLGSITGVKYHEQEFNVAPNDLIVLMSDGFPEMFNETGEMLGEHETRKIVSETASLSPQEIINHLVKVGENWAGARPQDDDVTFVVIKIGNNGNAALEK